MDVTGSLVRDERPACVCRVFADLYGIGTLDRYSSEVALGTQIVQVIYCKSVICNLITPNGKSFSLDA